MSPLATIESQNFFERFRVRAGWQTRDPFMEIEKQRSSFVKFAWFALGFNLLVILWGVFLRASFSGDGCGQHWFTCKGEVIPSAPEMKTVIEFTHRLTSGLALIVVVALWIWSRNNATLSTFAKKAAFASFVFIVIEALIGGGLVLTGNTAGAVTASRPIWMAGHLVNTFCLLAALTLTAYFARREIGFSFPEDRRVVWYLVAAFAGILLVGITGTFAALASMLFPSNSITEGLARDLSPQSHLWVRLRVLHPILSVALGVYLIMVAGWLGRIFFEHAAVRRWSKILSGVLLAQIIFGSLTLISHAPIAMQLVHLLFADAIVIALTILAAEIFAIDNNSTK